jgi:23S rRNA pseudouridine1911/1915/1917 synthase
MRLDRALVDLVPEFSRSYLQQLIELGSVSINHQAVQKASQKVKVYDLGSIELRPTPQSQAFKAEAMALDMVYLDEHLMVINKPAGLVVHPAPGNWSGTLMNGLLGYDAQAFNLPRAGIVHRLDKDTSGLMVVARSRTVMDALVRAIAAREVKRQYLALAHGAWRGDARCEVHAPIGRDPSNRLRMAVVDLASQAGKTARTDIELLANGTQGCLVKCTLHTGRTHQIRVHMTSIAHPLVADVVYGGTLAAGMQRQALHAYRLAFKHPVTDESLAFGADLPQDFSQALAQWGLQYNLV